jgi:hypothetical protein
VESTVREILAAHHSGISRPGLLAWARLRIDTAMTDEQLEAELARLGDEVVDVDGFLYLRSNRPAAAPRREVGPSWNRWTAELDGRTEPGEPTEQGAGPRWQLPARPSAGLRGCGTAVGVAVFLLWVLGFVGGLLEGWTEATPEPTATRPGSPTPSAGTVIPWNEVVVGDCIVVPTEDTFYEIRRVPCDVPHGGEVFSIVRHPGSAYPDDAAFASFADAACEPEFRAYTGTDVDDQDLLMMWWFAPTEEGWADGDRTVLCYLGRVDGGELERSHRAGS